MQIFTIFIALLFNVLSCSKDDKEGGSNYEFSSTVSQSIKSTSLTTIKLSGESFLSSGTPTLCTSVICLTPETLTGEYYGTGLMIQSVGNGMNAYFSADSWSDITESTDRFTFNAKTPIVHSGTLRCCTGSGDLEDENTYFSDALYMFAFLDATFTIDVGSGASGDAVGTHSVRFILADGAVPSAKRGDLMILDTDTAYKWMDQTGALSATRPATPITMNSKVVSWTNPYGSDVGNQTIPVMSIPLAAPTAGGVHQTSESKLKSNSGYTFDFNANGFIVFPDLLLADYGLMTSRKAMLEKIHIHALPYGDRGVLVPGDTKLTVTE